MARSEKYDLLEYMMPPICQKFVCETSQEFILILSGISPGGIKFKLGTTAQSVGVTLRGHHIHMSMYDVFLQK